MDYYPFVQPTGSLVELLQSQQSPSYAKNYEESASLSSSQAVGTDDGGESVNGGESVTKKQQRRTWTPQDDLVLISAWLNTSKDPVVANEQRAGTFWSRVAAYFAASRDDGSGEREPVHCKQHWHKINDHVCKFVGAYEAATRGKTSGQNDKDVLNKAYQIYQTNHKKKFCMEHCWRELRYDQKWCEALAAKNEGTAKKRKCDASAANEDEGGSSSQATHMKRPPGVKAAKSSGKKTVAEGKALQEFETIWTMRQQDQASNERQSKINLLQCLIAKTEPLLEEEIALKKKLINEMFS